MNTLLNTKDNSSVKLSFEPFLIPEHEQKAKSISFQNLYSYIQYMHYEMNEKDKKTKVKEGFWMSLKKSLKTLFSEKNLRKSKRVSKPHSQSQMQLQSQQSSQTESSPKKKTRIGLITNEFVSFQVVNSDTGAQFIVRVKPVYLDNPLIMIIFENQEIVKNNNKLKKQMETNNILNTCFFFEVSKKCELIKWAMKENQPSQVEFLFSLLQNNVYTIRRRQEKKHSQQQYSSPLLKKRQFDCNGGTSSIITPHLRLSLATGSDTLTANLNIKKLFQTTNFNKINDIERKRSIPYSMKQSIGVFTFQQANGDENSFLHEKKSDSVDAADKIYDGQEEQQNDYNSARSKGIVTEQYSDPGESNQRKRVDYEFQHLYKNQFQRTQSNNITEPIDDNTREFRGDSKQKIVTLNDNDQVELEEGNNNINTVKKQIEIEETTENTIKNQNCQSTKSNSNPQENNQGENAPIIKQIQNFTTKQNNINSCSNISQTLSNPQNDLFLSMRGKQVSLIFNNKPEFSKLNTTSCTTNVPTQQISPHQRSQEKFKKQISGSLFSPKQEKFRKNSLKVATDLPLQQTNQQTSIYDRAQRVSNNFMRNNIYSTITIEKDMQSSIMRDYNLYSSFDFNDILFELKEFGCLLNMKFDNQLKGLKIQNDKEAIVYVLKSFFSSVIAINYLYNRKQKKQMNDKIVHDFIDEQIGDFKSNEIITNNRDSIVRDHSITKTSKKSNAQAAFYKQKEISLSNQVLQNNMNRNSKNPNSFCFSPVAQNSRMKMNQSINNSKDESIDIQTGNSSSNCSSPNPNYVISVPPVKEFKIDFFVDDKKYAKSFVVSISNITKEELISCLNFNTNAKINQLEYDNIKEIIQKIGSQPLCYENNRVILSFLIDINQVLLNEQNTLSMKFPKTEGNDLVIIPEEQEVGAKTSKIKLSQVI